MAVKKISQLTSITNEIISGEAILPVVISDPLLPNRKSKVSQLFRCISSGTKEEPGLSFDLDRTTGFYQNPSLPSSGATTVGMSFGDSYLYYSTSFTSGIASITLESGHDLASSTNLILKPSGGGYVTTNGAFRVRDTDFTITDDQDSAKRAKFEISGISTGSGTKVFSLPEITIGTSTNLLGDNTVQTITNKIIIIDEDDFRIIDGTKTSKFGINWADTPAGTKTYFLPDPGTSVVSSTLIDDVSVQDISNKTLVQPKFAGAGGASNRATFDASQITSNITITIPNQSFTILGEASTQEISNKVYLDPVFADGLSTNKKVEFDLENLNAIPSKVGFRQTLNTLVTSYLVYENEVQTLKNKSLNLPSFIDDLSSNRKINFSLDNITAQRTIRFPDGDATLLSTNVQITEAVKFAGPIGAESFAGKLRLKSFFYASW